MLDTLEVGMPKLPQDGVLPFVPDHAWSLGVPTNGWRREEAVCEASVRHYASAFEGTNDSFDHEMLRVHRESSLTGAHGGEFLSYPPLGSHPFRNLGRPHEGSITI